jgi:hypothetical protein
MRGLVGLVVAVALFGAVASSAAATTITVTPTPT